MRSFKFEYEDQYSLSLDIYENELFTGIFTIDNNHKNFQTPFSGIGLRLHEDLFRLSFIVNWNHAKHKDKTYYTAFNGEISLENEQLLCLSLNWLLVSETERSVVPVKKSQGQSKLYENIITDMNDRNGSGLPFPNKEMLLTTDDRIPS